jgi:hypothetical protein
VLLPGKEHSALSSRALASPSFLLLLSLAAAFASIGAWRAPIKRKVLFFLTNQAPDFTSTAPVYR